MNAAAPRAVPLHVEDQGSGPYLIQLCSCVRARDGSSLVRMAAACSGTAWLSMQLNPRVCWARTQACTFAFASVCASAWHNERCSQLIRVIVRVSAHPEGFHGTRPGPPAASGGGRWPADRAAPPGGPAGGCRSTCSNRVTESKKAGSDLEVRSDSVGSDLEASSNSLTR